MPPWHLLNYIGKRPESKMKYLLQTFGCQMNTADSEKIRTVLLRAGCSVAESIDDADVLLLNTCSVRKKGEDRVHGIIRESVRRAESLGRTLRVGVTGCMVRKTGLARRHIPEPVTRTVPRGIEHIVSAAALLNSDDKLVARFPMIDFVVRIEEVGYLPQILSIVTGQEVGSDVRRDDYLRIQQVRTTPETASIVVQTGCDNFCAFCIVPSARGREVSRDMGEIVTEVREAVVHGAREIFLLGQNVNSYGKTERAKLWNADSLTWESAETRTPFRTLLEQVDAVPGVDRIRFTSSNPHDMTRDILDAHFDLAHTCHALHLALQSGSDHILRTMHRKHTYADFLAQATYLRSRDPLFSILTDIIVGFPGETEEDFAETVRAFEEIEFDFAYIARYSPRPGTRSADTLEDSVSPTDKARRWSILNDILRHTVEKRGRMMLGRREEILVSSVRDGTISGRTRNFREVFAASRGDIRVGDIIPVEITEVDRWVLRAEVR